MAQLTASRTLVKSSPELWAECSDAASLARHLGAFGEIQITKLEPETAVAWEGEDVRGTVTLEPSGWGTRVVLTADVPTPAVGVGEPTGDEAAASEAGPETEPLAQRDPVTSAVPGPVADDEPAPPGLLRRLFGSWRRSADPVLDPVPVPKPAEVLPVRAARIRPPIAPVSPGSAAPVASSEPVSPVSPVTPAGPAEPDSASAGALVGALDSLGRAHRRPFSHG